MAPDNTRSRRKLISATETLMLLFLAICIPVAIGSSEIVLNPLDPIVETPVGRIEGLQQEFLRKKVNVYLGVPYAEPPVGKLRFKFPVPAKPRDVINATEFSAACPHRDPFQSITNFSEDCLYLNIWTPITHDRTLKPVMVWIHGGGFTFGSTNYIFYEGLMLAAKDNVVVVSANYRLGALGFLSLGQGSEVPGNMGLMDQAEAILWVKTYIHLFGGDPDQITLFGESAGGSSVAFHLVSPVSKNLFKRAIIQSGGGYTGNKDNFDIKNYSGNSKMFVKMMGCNSEDDELRCLQESDLSEIIDNQYILLNQKTFYFGPTVDSYFLPDLPAQLLQEGHIGQNIREIFVGVNSDEGSILLPLNVLERFDQSPVAPNITEDEAKVIMNTIFNESLSPSEIEELSTFYFARYGGPLLYKAIYESYGDFLITCPAIYTSEDLADHERKVYFYEFAHRSNGTFTVSPFTGKWTGVRHFEEVPFVFGIPLRQRNVLNYTDADIELSKIIMDTWTNFAKTGRPTSQLRKRWPLFTRENPRYLKLKLPRNEEGIGFHAENCDEWRFIFFESLQDNVYSRIE